MNEDSDFGWDIVIGSEDCPFRDNITYACPILNNLSKVCCDKACPITYNVRKYEDEL